MRVVAKRTLRDYWERNPETEQALKAWHAEAAKADWKTPNDLKAQFRSASILKDSRAVFNICGNGHRLIVKINYDAGILFVKFVGTHAEYDRIDAETIDVY
jgi:mRNA interferase HigB